MFRLRSGEPESGKDKKLEFSGYRIVQGSGAGSTLLELSARVAGEHKGRGRVATEESARGLIPQCKSLQKAFRE